MLEYRTLRGSRLHRRTSSATPRNNQSPPSQDLNVKSSSIEYCDNYVSPACIMAMYNITRGTTATSGNELGIFEESPAALHQADLDSFFSHVAPEIPSGTFPKLRKIDGAINNNNRQLQLGGGETILDFEVAYPIIYPQTSVLYLTDSDYETSYARDKRGLFNTFLDAIVRSNVEVTNPADQFSQDGSYCSYSAYGEKGDNNTVDPKYPSPGYEHQLQCGTFKPTNVISFSYDFSELQEGRFQRVQAFPLFQRSNRRLSETNADRCTLYFLRHDT